MQLPVFSIRQTFTKLVLAGRITPSGMVTCRTRLARKQGLVEPFPEPLPDPLPLPEPPEYQGVNVGIRVIVDVGSGVLVGGAVSIGTCVWEAVGVKVSVGVLEGMGVSVGGAVVNVGVADNADEVSIADQV